MANRLINEKSPYLLQHANNPVDWYSWSDAAFDAARQAQKPVFLSVGYATCHWCHVMEKESFEDLEAARALNDAFICIKVDREERPDIDAVYMAACQMLTGSGGWPLTIIMTPDKEPFYAGTYLPKTSRFGRLGLLELCREITNLWHNDPQRIHGATEQIMGHLDRAFAFDAQQDASLPDLQLLNTAYSQISRNYDPQYGGFDGAPKFPTPHRLMFLLRIHHRTGDPFALEMVCKTLTAMRMGGLWDHLGFGFHRYSTDKKWRLPHFEKMLYDQALLAIAYLEAYQVTSDDFYAQTAREIFTYVLRDMTSSEGAFLSAEDADSEGEEGKFYVWSQEEFERLAAPGNIPWARIFNLDPHGNFHDEATGNKTGVNILYQTRGWHQWQKTLGGDLSSLIRQWESLRVKLFEHRRQRIHPLKDDKVLTDWNGLMIAALAIGSRVLNSERYAKAAQTAIDALSRRLINDQGQLLHRYRDGQAAIHAQAGDYAFLTMGLIELYRTTFNTDLLAKALELQKKMDAGFWDSRQGGYFSTIQDDKDLPVRPKELYDGAMPSINSVALSNLLLLGRLTGDPIWEQKAHALCRSFAGTITKQPVAFTHFLNGLDLALQPGQEVIVTGNCESNDTQELLKALRSQFSPHLVAQLKADQNATSLARLAGFTAGLAETDNQATAHICVGTNCQNSTTDVNMLLKLLLDKKSTG